MSNGELDRTASPIGGIAADGAPQGLVARGRHCAAAPSTTVLHPLDTVSVQGEPADPGTTSMTERDAAPRHATGLALHSGSAIRRQVKSRGTRGQKHRAVRSPLRYPGGKASLAPLLAQVIEANGVSGCSYFEPFAGGAGAALSLLQEGYVSKLHLNDLDQGIVAFWRAVLEESERFAEKIMSVPLTIEEWKKQQAIYKGADFDRFFDLGFSVFYLNRCNRSGILAGSAPIGGYAQEGKWKIDARFYRATLAGRVRAIAKKRKNIHVTNMNALDFLVECLPNDCADKKAFVYLDPPYYRNGKRLYLNSYRDEDHRRLAKYMLRQTALKWVMSYDDSAFIRELYNGCQVEDHALRYSLQKKKEGQEVIIMPHHVRPPIARHGVYSPKRQLRTA